MSWKASNKPFLFSHLDFSYQWCSSYGFCQQGSSNYKGLRDKIRWFALFYYTLFILNIYPLQTERILYTTKKKKVNWNIFQRNPFSLKNKKHIHIFFVLIKKNVPNTVQQHKTYGAYKLMTYSHIYTLMRIISSASHLIFHLYSFLLLCILNPKASF